jgi:two-component system chemotaxis response regulator CheB
MLLEHIIGNDSRLEVAGAVGSAEEALRIIGHVRPDVLSLDVRLPGMNGLEATRRIMHEHPVPIVVVAAEVEGGDLNITMNALRAGALAVVAKPGGVERSDYAAVAEDLCTQLFIMSQVKVVRQRPPRDQGGPRPGTIPAVPAGPSPFRIVGLVASTGGPTALARVLSDLGAGFSKPVLVVQHIGAPFIAGFAEWLGTVSPLPVVLAQDRMVAAGGFVYVAPGNRHLAVDGLTLRLVDGEAVAGQKPSGSVMFSSLAVHCGPAAVGVLLTGMGEDGAQGLLELREAGGHTIAEDASTAIIWGMPGTAMAIGAAQEMLPLPSVGARLRQLFGRREAA